MRPPGQAGTVVGIHHASRSVSDMDRSLGFYRDLLGMEIVLDTHYYEGTWKQVFEVDGTKLSKVLEASCLV